MSQSLPNLSSVVNFALLVGGLTYLLKEPIKAFLKQRSEAIELDLQESQALEKQASEKYSFFKEKISLLGQEIKELLGKADKEGQAEKKIILQRADRMELQIQDSGQRAILREQELLEKNAQAACLKTAIVQAKEKIKTQAGEKEHAVFLNHFLKQLEDQHGR